MKNVSLIVLLLVIAIGSLFLSFHFAQKANKAAKNLEEERYSRMVAEETLQKDSGKLAALYAQLKEAQEKMTKIEDILDQEKNVNVDLKKQYDDLEQSKSDLENKLQALVQNKEPGHPETKATKS